MTIKSHALVWDLRRQDVETRASHFVTLTLPGLLDWSVFESVSGRVVRLLREEGVLFLAAPDFATVGLHLAVVLFVRGGDQSVDVERLGESIANESRRFVEGARVYAEPARTLEGAVHYAVRHKRGAKFWILPEALGRKRLVSYSSDLLSAPLWRLEREYLQAVRAGKAPSPWPSRRRLLRFHQGLRGPALARSAPLIEAMDRIRSSSEMRR